MLEPTASVPMRPKSMLLPEEVPDLEKVGKFDDDKVEEPENNIHHDQEESCWNTFTNFFKNVKYTILGVTIKATVVWAIVYVIAIIINCVGDSWESKCEEEQLWTLDTTLKLVNHHTTLTYTWGLQETGTNSGTFYIKDKNQCTGTTWYSLPVTNSQTPPKGQARPSGRQKRQAVSGAPLKCLTQTFMGHTITPEQFSAGKKTQMWKIKLSDIKGKKGRYQTSQYFKLFMADEEGTSTDKKSEKPKDTNTYVSATSKVNEFESKENCKSFIDANAENFRTFETNTRKVITFLIGFFVATALKRWWDQTSKIPRLEKLAISLNAIMQEAEGEQGPEPMKKVKREILRLAALSYAIVMISISGEYADKPEVAIKFLKEKKGLLKDEEIKALGFTEDQLKEKKRIFSATGAAMLKWWLPLNWAAGIVQVEQKKGGHLLKEGKVIAGGLINLFDKLEDVADYSQRPMPKIALQAVQFVFWVSLVIGTLDNHHTNWDNATKTNNNPFIMLLLDIGVHLDELIVYILFYTWIRMAEIVQNPFDGHKHYDIDVFKSIDTELYGATVALHF